MTALWLIVVAYGSVDPRPVEAGPPGLPGSSVVAHVGAYAILAVLWFGSLKAVFPQSLRWVQELLYLGLKTLRIFATGALARG